MTRFIPDVRIGGDPIAPSWDGTSIAAVASIQITWGRTDAFSQPDPASLQFVIIDPDGLWSGDPGLYDKRLTISLPDLGGKIIYQGDVSGVSSRRRKLTPPGETTPRWVWMTTITAADPLAALSRLRPAGNPAEGPNAALHPRYVDWYGSGYWMSNGPQPRQDRIMAAGGSAVIDSLDGTGGFWVPLIAGKEHVSLLEVIQRAFSWRAMGHVNYRPESNSVAMGLAAVAGTLRLAYAGGKLVLQSATGLLIPAGSIGTPDAGLEIVSTVADAIDSVAINGYTYSSKAYTNPAGQTTVYAGIQDESMTPYPRAVPGVQPRGRELVVDTGLPLGSSDNVPPAPTGQAKTLGDELVALVADMNGRNAPAGLFYDWDALPALTATLDDLLFTLYDRPTPIYFSGAYTAGFRNHGPFFQIIGGTLSYVVDDNRDGWRHELNLTTAPTTTAAVVTYANWVTNTTARYMDFDAAITWADFANVTTGAA